MATVAFKRAKLAVTPVATELATLKPVSEVKPSEVAQKDEKWPSRQAVNAIYNVARSANKIHQVIHPSSADFDDDDDGIMDDDDDDDNDTEEDGDDDIDETRYDDEPVTDHEDSQASTSHTTFAHNTTNFDNMATVAAASVARNTRDPDAVRYVLSPEKQNDLRTEAASKKSAGDKPNEEQSRLPSATHNEKTTKSASAPETKSITSTQGQTQPKPKPIPSLPASDKVQPSTSLTVPKSTPAVVSAKPKADALAPTAAAPYGYKIVTVKKPDGIIGKVKRPLKEGEKPPGPAAKKSTPAEKVVNAEKTTAAKSPSSVDKTAPAKKSMPAPENVTATKNDDASATATMNEKIKSSASSTSLATTSELKNFDEVPLLPGVPEKKLDGVRITVNEIDQGIASLRAALPKNDEPAKGAHKLAGFMKVLIWVVCLMFPLFFLALGIVTAAMNEKRVPGGYGSNSDDLDGGLSTGTSNYHKPGEGKDPLTQVITVAASVWPIVFAAIVAQSLKMYAAYRVERGIRLVMLEQLISSHSVGGAIKQPFMLRTFNWTTLLLFLIWCLSPLAGQAILRMSTTVEDFDFVNSSVTYFSAQTFETSDRGNPWAYTGSDDDYSLRRSNAEIPKAITLALLQGYHQTQNSTQDIYRNVRIPAAVNTTVVSDADAMWYTPTYSSLLGYPVWIKDQKNPEQITTFNMTSSYFSFNCSNLTSLDPYGPVMQSHNLTYDGNSLIFAAANNTDDSYTEVVRVNSSAPYANTTQQHHSVNVTYTQPGPVGSLYLVSTLIGDTDIQAYFSECSYHNVVVNTSVYCESTELNATCDAYNWDSEEISDSRFPTMSLGYWFPYLLQWAANDEIGISDIQYFLFDPSFASRRNDTDQIFGLDLSKVTSAQLSERLNLVANTLWSVYLEKKAFVSTGGSAWFDGSIPIANTSARASTQTYKVYVVYWEWIAVLISCSVVLLVASGAAIIWETRVIGPDFLGFANTAIKKSVKMPKSMSMLDARDRLQALHECEVLLQDVKPDNAVGKIALGVKEDTSAMLVAGRRYR